MIFLIWTFIVLLIMFAIAFVFLFLVAGTIVAAFLLVVEIIAWIVYGGSALVVGVYRWMQKPWPATK